MPGPCGGDDRLDVVVFHLPIEIGFGFAGIGIKRWWVAGPARSHGVRNRKTGYFFDRFDDLQYRSRGSSAEIVEQFGARFGQFIEDGDVRTTEVIDMNVVA